MGNANSAQGGAKAGTKPAGHTQPMDIPSNSTRPMDVRTTSSRASGRGMYEGFLEAASVDTSEGFTPGSVNSYDDVVMPYGEMGYENPVVPPPTMLPATSSAPIGSKEMFDPSSAQAQQDGIPTVFEWEGGHNPPNQVFIVGSFNDWQMAIPLSRSHTDFSTILYLPKGSHQYKFIVDGEWQYAPDKPIVKDAEGNINNTIEVKEMRDMVSKGKGGAIPVSASPPGTYTNEIPAEHIHSMAYDKPPPVLPPHLRVPILSKAPEPEDPDVLPVPHHVMLNHLTILSVKDNVLVLGCTSRLRKKFVSTVIYKPFARRRSNSRV